MAILYVAAESAELKPFAEQLTAVRKLKWPLDYAIEGILGGEKLILTANGAGPQLAARAVETALRAAMVSELSASRLRAVFSTGFCGALDPALAVGDIVVATAVSGESLLERHEALPVDCALPFRSGVIWTQNSVANSAADKRSLLETGALAVEMEAAGVAERAKRAGLPFGCIKVVSDGADESLPLDLNAMRTAEGRVARGKIIRHTLLRPHLLPALLRLKKRADAAARSLGEFLVSCRISEGTADRGAEPALGETRTS